MNWVIEGGHLKSMSPYADYKGHLFARLQIEIHRYDRITNINVIIFDNVAKKAKTLRELDHPYLIVQGPLQTHHEQKNGAKVTYTFVHGKHLSVPSKNIAF